MGSSCTVVIIGAGPAGLTAAYELSKHGVKPVIIEEGRNVKERNCPMLHLGHCAKCKPCSFIQGVGGGGTFSDGKLNLNPEIGGSLLEFVDKDEAYKLIGYVEGMFVRFGGKDIAVSGVGQKTKELERKAKMAGVKYIPIRQRHIGSDHLPELVSKMVAEMQKKGVKLLVNTKAEELVIENGKVTGVVVKDCRSHKVSSIPADYVIVASGRGGAPWFGGICKKNRIQTKFQPLDVGVRVEVPNEIMDEVTAINWDPKFHIRTKKYDDFVRTFCTNPGGYIITESYDGFVCVNGHSMKDKHSENTNFAFLVQIALTEPVEDTTAYGQGIAKLAAIIGGGKPTLQRLGDLKAGRRSTWQRINRSYVSPTHREVTPGDISMSLPARIVDDIVEGLDALNKVIPGVAEDGTLLYAPEIKFHALRVSVSKEMETGVTNLFAVGDGAGVSRGIIGASVSGLMAARSVLKRLGKDIQKGGE